MCTAGLCRFPDDPDSQVIHGNSQAAAETDTDTDHKTKQTQYVEMTMYRRYRSKYEVIRYNDLNGTVNNTSEKLGTL